MNHAWRVLTPDPRIVRMIREAARVSPITAAVMANRGLHRPEQIDGFIDSSLHRLTPPDRLNGMDAAVHRLGRAIRDKERILVVGDYDVDGISSTAILCSFLGRAGADAVPHIPHRLNEGYGFKASHVSDVAAPTGASLILTADCGASDREAVVAARARGMDVIVTDHHRMSADIPEAIAVVNPSSPACASGLEHLAGAGVAFYLLIGLRAHLRSLGFWRQRPEPNLKTCCDLVALGTVADVVPLIGENRIFTRAGLDVIRNGSRPGIRALMHAAGVRADTVSAEDIAFRLGPRLNAAGRMDHARIGLELLTTPSPDRAVALADELNVLNRQRQTVENRILEAALEEIAQDPRALNRKSIVLAGKEWSPGVIGIVASRLVDRFFRPVILVAGEGPVRKGSGRSIPGFDLYKGVRSCAHELVGFGGHAMAAGIGIEDSRIEHFRSLFEEEVCRCTRPEDFVRVRDVDAEIALDDITPDLLDEFERLAPFGAGNPQPLFMSRDVEVVRAAPMGANHRRMYVRSPSGDKGRALQAVQFKVKPDSRVPARLRRLVCRIQWNYWNGRKAIQLLVEDME